MNQTTANRAARRKAATARIRKAAWAGTTATAVAVGLALAPQAQAVTINIDRDYTWDPTYSSGLLASILNFVSNALPGQDLALTDQISYTTGPPAAIGIDVAIQTAFPGVPVVGTIGVDAIIGLKLNLRNINSPDAKTLYNTMAAIPLQGNPCGGGQASGTDLSPKFASNCRYALQLATSQAVLNLIDAYRTQIGSVRGGPDNTPPDYIPFGAAPGATAALPSWTNEFLALVQNPLRPNGGLAARFPDIARALGVNPVMPSAGKTVSPDGRIVLNASTLDLTWAYDPVGDFPAAWSPFAIANSLAATLPLNLIGGFAAEPLQGDSFQDIGLNLAAILQLPLDVVGLDLGALGTVGISTLPMVPGTLPAFGPGKAFYGTLVGNQLPLLTPIRLPGIGINAVLGALNSPFLLGNPFADAIEPALRILVNSGYTDVLASGDINTCATGCTGATPQSWGQLGYQAYDRTFGALSVAGDAANGGTATPFGSLAPLTPEERRALPGDVWNALIAGIQAQFEKPFWGILVPANPQEEVTPPAAVKAASAALPAAAESAAPAPAPLVSNSVAAEATPGVSVSEAEPDAAAAPVEVSAPEPAAPVSDDAPVEPVAAEEVDVALADEAPAESPEAGSGTTRRGGDATQRRGATADSDDSSSSDSSSSDRGRAAN
jgi:hypothetical protein